MGKESQFVVTSTLSSRAGELRVCLDRAGNKADSRLNWVRFSSWKHAKEWAAEKGIQIDNVLHYIVEAEFSDQEMALYWKNKPKDT